MSAVTDQTKRFARELDEQISEARSLLADPRLEGWEPLSKLVRDTAHEAVLSYIFDAGIRRLRKCKTTVWTSRFDRVLQAYERRGHDLALERMLREAKCEATLRGRLEYMALRKAPLPQVSLDALLASKRANFRGVALESLAARITEEQLERYIELHGIEPRVLEVARARVDLSPQLLSKILPALLFRLYEVLEHRERCRLWEIIEAYTINSEEHRACIARHLELFDQEYHGLLDLVLDLEQRAWLSQWYGRAYPDYSTRPTSCARRKQPEDMVEAMANRLRKQGAEGRLATFFGELELDRHALSQKVWERIANAIDHAPTHEERLRLTSLLLKASEKPRNYPRIAHQTRHWTEHGSGGATRRAGHKGSRRSNRGASQRRSIDHSHQRQGQDEAWNDYDGHWYWWTYRHDPSVSRYQPNDHDPHGAVVMRDLGCDVALEELERLDNRPVLRLNLQNFEDHPRALARMLEHTRLEGLERLAITTLLDNNLRAGVIAGNISWSSFQAKARFYRILNDASLAHMIDAIAASPAYASLTTLVVGDGFIGQRTFQALTRYLDSPSAALRTLGLSGSQIDDAAFVAFIDSANLANLTSLWTDTGDFRDGYEEYNHCERFAARLPEHLRPANEEH